MKHFNLDRGLKIFITVWIGQVISTFGSNLTSFALGVWVYRLTGSATQFALISMFTLLPRVLAAPIAGIIVDRYDRRVLMIISCMIGGLVTAGLAFLVLINQLSIWSIYLAVVFSALSAMLYDLSFSASISVLVSKQHYSRANGMDQFGFAISFIAAPMLAGMMILTIGIWGILLIDSVTFLFCISTLLVIRFPKCESSDSNRDGKKSMFAEMTFGWRYLKNRHGLLSLLVFYALGNFCWGIADVLFTPFILSFTNAAVLGRIVSSAGLGMLIGSILMSMWSGFKRRITSIVYQRIFEGILLSLLAFFGYNTILISVAVVLHFISLQVTTASTQAIWQSKVAPEYQGRVFAFREMIAFSTLPAAYIIAGPLADYIFEPLMTADGYLAGSVGHLIGVGPGRGIALLYILLGIIVFLTSVMAHFYKRLRYLEEEIPDFKMESPESITEQPEEHAERS